MDPFIKSIENATRGRVTSAARTVQQQNDLADAGKTRARGPNAPHVRQVNGNPGAVDLVDSNQSDEKLRQNLGKLGLTVTRIRVESGKGRNQGTGAHRHVEFGAPGSQFYSGNAGVKNNPALPAESQAPSASAGEVAQSQQPFESSIQNVFSAGPTAGAQTQEVKDRAQTYDSALTDEITRVTGPGGIQDMREAQLKAATAVKNDTTAMMQQSTTTAIAKATPLWQKRQEIADRRAELASMNPIKRFFAGLTDSRYDPHKINAEAVATERELAVQDANYKEQRTLYGDVIENMNQTFSDNNAVLTNEEADANATVNLLGQSVTSAGNILGLTMQGVANQANLDQAMEVKKNLILSDMTEGMLTQSVAAAKTDGYAVIQGVKFPLAKLQEHQQAAETTRLNLESMRMGRQMGELQYADAMEMRTIQSMTPEQRKSALAAGGMFQGQQLNSVKLAATVQQDMQVAEQSNQNLLTDMAPKMWQDGMRQLQAAHSISSARAVNLFGRVPESYGRFANQAAQQYQVWGDLITKARANGTEKQMIAQLLPEIQKAQAAESAQVEAMAKQFGGQNKALTQVARGWLSGQPVSAPDAVSGLVTASRDSLPTGAVMSPESNRIFASVKQSVSAWDKARPLKKDQDEPGLLRMVQQKITALTVGSQLDRLVNKIPAYARGVTDSSGKMHPFAQIPADDYLAAVQAGDRQGLSVIANDMGIAVTEVQAILTGTPQGQTVLKTLVDSGKIQSANQFQNRVVGAQTGETLRILDANFTAKGFRPSTALVDLLHNPKFQQRVMGEASAVGQASMGDFLIQSAGGPGFGQKFSSYVATVGSAAQATRSSELVDVGKRAFDLRSNPQARVKFILANIDGLSASDRQILTSYISDRSEWFTATTSMSSNNGAVVADEVDSIVLNQKSGDPRVEAIRKKAAAQWEQMSRIHAKGLTGLTEGN